MSKVWLITGSSRGLDRALAEEKLMDRVVRFYDIGGPKVLRNIRSTT